MAVRITGGGGGLSYSARLDVSQAIKDAERLKKAINDIPAVGSGGKSSAQAKLDAQDAINKIKLQTLELNKQKADSLAAAAKEKAAQAEINTQIKQNTLARQAEAAATKAQLALDKERASQAAKIPRPFISETSPANIDPIGQTTGSLDTSKSVEQLQTEMAALQAAKAEILSFYEAGTIGAETYNGAITALSAKERELSAAIQNYGAATVLATESSTAATVAMETERGAIEGLKLALKELNAQKLLANESNLPVLNREIQEVEREIVRLGNVGRTGFDSLGNAIATTGRAAARSTNFFKSAWSSLRQIAYILPGIGIAGILAFVTGPIIDYISQLDIFKTKLSQAKANLDALNEINKNTAKSYGEQSAALKILYGTATDVTKATKDRTAAAQELKKEFPDAFANSKLSAILNGQEKDSYDQLTKSILENARAKAIKDQYGDFESKRIAAEIQKQKILNAQAAETEKSVQYYAKALKANNPGMTDAQARAAASKATFDQAKYEKQVRGQVAQAPLTANDPRGINGELNEINVRANDALKAQDQIIKLADGTEKIITKYAGGSQKIAAEIEGNINLIKDPLKRFDEIIKNASSESDLTNLKTALEAKLKALAPDDKQIATYQSKIKQVEVLLKQYNPKISDDNSYNQALKKRLQLLDQVQVAITTVNTRQLTEDQRSLTAISDKFDDLKNKISAFNADPKNRGVKIGDDVVSKIDTAQNTAIDNQANLNENKFIADDIEKKKKLYSDYEKYRSEVGTDAANKEYADLLRSGKDFQEYLTNIENSIDKSDLSGPIQERSKTIEEYLKNLTEEQRVELQHLLVDYATYAQRRQAIIKVSVNDELRLRNAGATEQADQIRDDLNDQLTQLDEANFMKLALYRNLFDSIDRLSTQAAKKQIAVLYGIAGGQLAAGKITVDAYVKIIKGLDSASDELNAKLPDGLKKVGSELSNIGSLVSDFDAGLGKALNTVGSLVSGIGSIKGSLNTISNPKSSTLDQLSAGLAIVGTAISVFSAIGGLFSNAKEKAEQLQYQNELQQKAVEAVNKALERQLDLTNKLYGPEKISGYLKQLADIKVAEDDINSKLGSKITLTGNKELDDEIAKLNNGQKGNRFIDDLIKQLVAAGKLGTLAGKSLEDLQKLADNGKLDATTADMVQSLVTLQQQAIDTQNQLNDALTGINFDGLLDNVVSLFENATTSAEDFADNFEKIIQGALLNSFKRDFLEKQLQGFYDNLTDLTQKDGTLTQTDISALQKQYDDILNNANVQFKNLQAATGVVFNDSNSSVSSARGQVSAAITEDTASQSMGIWRGTQTATLQVRDEVKALAASSSSYFLMARDTFNVTVQIEANTKRTANNTDRLENIEKALKSIDTKTNSTSMRGAGLG